MQKEGNFELSKTLKHILVIRKWNMNETVLCTTTYRICYILKWLEILKHPINTYIQSFKKYENIKSLFANKFHIIEFLEILRTIKMNPRVQFANGGVIYMLGVNLNVWLIYRVNQLWTILWIKMEQAQRLVCQPIHLALQYCLTIQWAQPTNLHYPQMDRTWIMMPQT